jgi:hypothetical protein
MGLLDLVWFFRGICTGSIVIHAMESDWVMCVVSLVVLSIVERVYKHYD